MTQIAVNLPDSDARFVKEYASTYGLSVEELFVKYVQALQLARKYPVSEKVKELIGLIPKEAKPEEDWREHNLSR
jgi:hypothetical protein